MINGNVVPIRSGSIAQGTKTRLVNIIGVPLLANTIELYSSIPSDSY